MAQQITQILHNDNCKTLNNVVKSYSLWNLRRFDLLLAELDHAVIRVGDSAQMVVVAGSKI